MSKRVYKFTCAKYGIDNLRKKRLKLTTIDELNDPFDLCAIDTSDPAVRKLVDTFTEKFRKANAILCFSRNWDNLLLWSHYGDSHKGVCLGLDVPEREPGADYDSDVLYRPNVLPAPHLEYVNGLLIDSLLRTKHESWSYEQEVRMFFRLNDPPDEKGLNWIEFGPQLVLREVIIGPQCDPEMSKQAQEAVAAFGGEVKLWWAGMRHDAFLLVKQDSPPWWHATVT